MTFYLVSIFDILQAMEKLIAMTSFDVMIGLKYVIPRYLG